MKNIFLSTILVLSIVYLYSQSANADPSCDDIDMRIDLCARYAKGKLPKPSPECCGGLKEIAKDVTDVNDKKAICKCALTSLKKIPGAKEEQLNKLPTACGITELGFPESLNADCDKIQ